jgi:hypothetical protein
MVDFPLYLSDPTIDEKAKAADNYQQQLNDTLVNNLGPNGWNVTNITDADLTTTPILDPNTGQFTTVKDLAPIGAVWFVTDASPAIWVGKQSDGPTVLVKFTVSSYP